MTVIYMYRKMSCGREERLCAVAESQNVSNIVGCVVMKENFEDDNYLAAYVQVKDSNESETKFNK